MARIAGVELQDNLKVDYALTRIRGIGWPLSQKILAKAGISGEKRVSTLSSDELSKIANQLENYPTEGELARRVKGNILRLTTVGAYRGVRHQKNLPVRGQRTRSNARTKRGKRKTVGAFKKEMLRERKGAPEVTEKK
ncbi:30S ribosomal protein S13 [Candidatus Woesebacteria bacterium RBG_19FT_COMBO_42_9]|uniref:Small ribosomal subunit protein uS13 n=1 Tax=Candidatus Woesebacteria bacterium RBG_16_42_24 TaxID=1802485 RepID=A0A1F7XMC3_9BACT|nr:MAG: 30S ribosomal protein S13 [Candidatus Woesebacteria bacterium RBG_16_42_24]OGM17757.1 MAG: 30S ribosomal protein S13 [Candidatus Woesebacteria bacterium RBG_19FT_COMBO_42_9]OGM66847.1 MAG: 30S ribosomal protein S13 [Candidatus Woesebacteria bacterium RIFCSPLOWO2_01_FULL_43_11]